jgi:hypothetical protein
LISKDKTRKKANYPLTWAGVIYTPGTLPPPPPPIERGKGGVLNNKKKELLREKYSVS